MDNLHETMRQILAFRDQRDWAQFHTPRNLVAALVVEAGELQETMLWKSDEEVRDYLSSPRGKTELSGEIADVLIFALLLCHAVGIDPIDAIKNKIHQNAEKYPVELSRGKSSKYTRLKPDSE